MKNLIKIGTRGSQLALWQANHIKNLLERFYREIKVSIIVIKTKGDQIIDQPLKMIGGKGLFVKEIENHLLNHDIDLAVHSMKDMPGDMPLGLMIGAIPERENPFDVMIANKGLSLSEYPLGARVGTSSLRREAQLKHFRPDFKIFPIRGNLDTRLQKLKSGQYDAIVLAAAGLKRLGQESEITQILDETVMIPAVGQGALCLQIREADMEMQSILKKLNHEPTRICISGERAFMQRISGSCHIPVACFAKIEDKTVILTALVASVDGRQLIRFHTKASFGSVQEEGHRLAEKILEKGGKTILEKLNSYD